MHIKNWSVPSTLVFLDPYHKLWTITNENGGAVVATGSHDLAEEYANAWSLDPKDLGQQTYEPISADLRVTFTPANYLRPLLYGSGAVAGIAVITAIVLTFYHKKRS